MNIFSPQDQSRLPEMIGLLKDSLGEGLMPKSETYFKWKHYDNPFGASYLLLAEEEGKLVGLRAFMRWRWVAGEASRSAVRAVDTATHPDYQGKGIFKKLTLQCVEQCKADGVDMVFNSPNPISKAGYLKMGWQQAGRMPLHLGWGSFRPKRLDDSLSNATLQHYQIGLALSQLPDHWEISLSTQQYHTPLNKAYLRWRFEKCPVANYGAVIHPGQFGFIFRLKPLKNWTELRICEAWMEPGFTDNKAFSKALSQIIRSVRPLAVSMAPSPFVSSSALPFAKFFGPFQKGPVTTVRPLAMESMQDFLNFEHWQPSIGAMELF